VEYQRRENLFSQIIFYFSAGKIDDNPRKNAENTLDNAGKNDEQGISGNSRSCRLVQAFYGIFQEPGDIKTDDIGEDEKEEACQENLFVFEKILFNKTVVLDVLVLFNEKGQCS